MLKGSRCLWGGSAAKLICARMHSLAGCMRWNYCCMHIHHAIAATFFELPAAVSVTLCCSPVQVWAQQRRLEAAVAFWSAACAC